MYVPTNKRLNVDMEWLKDDAEHSMEVDIGYMPEMGLVATSESRPAEWNGYDLRTSHKPETNPPDDQLGGLVWTKEVQVDVCEKSMEVVFYPFTTVPYHNYTEAYELAAKENKHYLTLEKSHPVLARHANQSMEAYTFPVQIVLARPDGTVLTSVNLNEFMEFGRTEESEAEEHELSDQNIRYLDLLKEALSMV